MALTLVDSWDRRKGGGRELGVQVSPLKSLFPYGSGLATGSRMKPSLKITWSFHVFGLELPKSVLGIFLWPLTEIYPPQNRTVSAKIYWSGGLTRQPLYGAALKTEAESDHSCGEYLHQGETSKCISKVSPSSLTVPSEHSSKFQSSLWQNEEVEEVIPTRCHHLVKGEQKWYKWIVWGLAIRTGASPFYLQSFSESCCKPLGPLCCMNLRTWLWIPKSAKAGRGY